MMMSFNQQVCTHCPLISFGHNDDDDDDGEDDEDDDDGGNYICITSQKIISTSRVKK